jgi:hypothetical protein
MAFLTLVGCSSTASTVAPPPTGDAGAHTPDGGRPGEGGSVREPDGGAAEAGAVDARDDASAPGPCSATSVSVSLVDYFSGETLSGSASIDGASAGGGPFCVGPGVHPVSIKASGYATYNGAIQLPGGATSRTIRLFPVSTAVAGWLALVNMDRQSNGAPPVQLDNALTIAAWDHAIDMGTQGYVGHFDPHGFAPTTRSLMLGSMLMGSEDFAYGYPTYEVADNSFMVEKAQLPNQTASDCAAHDALADHYCNIVSVLHNWVGLAVAKMPASTHITYYDQEFGDLYGYFDTTVLAPEAPADASAPVTLVPAPGYTFKSEDVGTMAAPTPISIATINADPGCASMCPPGDVWYATGTTAVSTTGPAPYVPMLSSSEVVFVSLWTNVMPFVGASVYAAFWGSGNVTPDTYGASSKPYLVP